MQEKNWSPLCGGIKEQKIKLPLEKIGQNYLTDTVAGNAFHLDTPKQSLKSNSMLNLI